MIAILNIYQKWFMYYLIINPFRRNYVKSVFFWFTSYNDLPIFGKSYLNTEMNSTEDFSAFFFNNWRIKLIYEYIVTVYYL